MPMPLSPHATMPYAPATRQLSRQRSDLGGVMKSSPLRAMHSVADFTPTRTAFAGSADNELSQLPSRRRAKPPARELPKRNAKKEYFISPYTHRRVDGRPDVEFKQLRNKVRMSAFNILEHPEYINLRGGSEVMTLSAGNDMRLWTHIPGYNLWSDDSIPEDELAAGQLVSMTKADLLRQAAGFVRDHVRCIQMSETKMRVAPGMEAYTIGWHGDGSAGIDERNIVIQRLKHTCRNEYDVVMEIVFDI